MACHNARVSTRAQYPSPHGRGLGYHPVRGLVESLLSQVYRGDWPAKLWQRWPGAGKLVCVRHELAWLSPHSQPLRLGYVSDLHLGPTTPQPLLEAAFAELTHARPDVLLLGGDYVFLEATREKARRLAELIERVPAKRKLAVLGNHDLWTHHSLLEDGLTQVGVELIENRSVELGAGCEHVVIAGLDDPWTGHPDAERALQNVGDPRVLVVLCHSPDALPQVLRELGRRPRAQHRLYVCGHTHGGQIATPWGPIIVPGHVGKRYPHGMHRVGSTHLHVSRGVGATELPIRSFAPPEVAIFDLLPAPSA
jgi:predicted MPP superfamily phosphohydrolase